MIRAAALFFALTMLQGTAWAVSAKDVFAEVAASVVVVLALNEAGETVAQGSGVVVGDYEVVTNCHVLDGAATLAVRQAADWSGGGSYRMTASLLASNQERDLCLLFAKELPVPPAAKVARVGSAKALSVGDEVYAVGAPAGLDLSLSRGVVSQLRGVLGKRSAPLVQTDAAISPGSSGGGLFNEAGELVGITTFKYQGENLNFAVPAEWVEELRTQGRSELSKATARAACVTEPNYECVVELALQSAETARSAYPSDSHFLAGLLLDIAATQADVGDASGAWRTLRAAASEAARGIPKLKSMARIAIAQTNIGDLQGAEQTISALRVAVDAKAADPLEIPNMGLGYLAAALAQTGQIAQAFEVALRIDKGDRNRLLALAEIAQAQAGAGDATTAVTTASSIMAGINWKKLFAHEKAGTLRPDLQTALDRMRERGMAWPDEFANVNDGDRIRNQALAGIAFMQAKGGDYEGAMKTVMGIGDKAVAQDPHQTWHKLLSDEAAGRLSPKMQTLLDEARRRGLVPDEAMGIGFYWIASWQLARGEHEAAEQTIISSPSFLLSGPARLLLRLVSAIVQAKKGNFPVALAIAEAKKGDFPVALAIAEKMDVSDENGLRVAVLNEIAALQARSGNSRAAERTLQIALMAARAEGGLLHRASMLSAVAVAQAKAGDSQAARHLLDEAATNLEAAEGDILHLSYVSNIAGRQAGAGFAAMGVETALGIHHPIDEIREAQLRVEALVSIARHLAGKLPPPLVVSPEA